jgi:hypothetical protein
MQNKRTTFFLALCASVAFSAAAWAQSDRSHTISTRDSDRCDAYNANFDDERTYAAEEQQTLPAGLNNIFIHGAHNGGIKIQGTTGNAVQVRVCKLVGAEDDASGQRRLAMIHPMISGGDISANGPDDGNWVVHFTVLVPSGSTVKAEAYNGPIGVRDVNGNVDVNTHNGPVSLKGVSGTVNVTAQNGPISIAQSSGNIKVSAQNGPLSVNLSDKQWNGQGLDASTHNGPLTLRLPAGFSSGVDIETSGHSPLSCHMAECSSYSTSKPWDRQKMVHIGGSPTLIHLSTVNGPVSIRGMADESQQ